MKYNEHKCDAILTFNNQQLFCKPVEREWCISWACAYISMYQTRDSVNNALYDWKQILEQIYAHL